MPMIAVRPADVPGSGEAGSPATGSPATGREQSRARYPDVAGNIGRADGGWVAWEAYGSGDPPIVLVPPWQIVHSRVWKAQIPDFARRHRVVVWDARGNGRSDRPRDPNLLTTRAKASDLGAVMDAAGLDAAILVGLSSASGPMVVFAAEHPRRVLAMVFVCPASPLGQPSAGADVPFEDALDSDEGWNKENIHYWRRDFPGFLEHFFAEAFPEPHSTKQREDGVGWGLDTDADSLAVTERVPRSVTVEEFRAMCASLRCPALVLQGTDERISHFTQGEGLARAIPGARLVLLAGAGHIPTSRHPVRVNLAIREFIDSLSSPGS
jgi:pimeloyl-ACP methyl ester carboxylesterase